MLKLTFRNRRESDKLRKLYLNGNGHPDIFSRPQVTENSRQYLLFRTDILQKKSGWMPLKCYSVRFWPPSVFSW